MCSKCFYLKSLSEHLNLKWWLDINTAIGYEKISICENYLNESFYSNYTNLKVESIRCAPKLHDSKSEYVNSFFEYVYNGRFYFTITDIVNLQVINQCFIENAHKAKYISIFDNDEVIIPRMDKKYFKINDYRNFLRESQMDNYEQIEEKMNLQVTCRRYAESPIKGYLNELSNLYEIKQDKQMYFLQGIYLKYESVQKFLEKISINLQSRRGANFNISISTNDIPHFASNKELLIEFDGQDDIIYAKKLLDINEKYYKVFIAKNQDSLENISENFQSIFAIIDVKGRPSNFGKSVHFTSSYYPVCFHTLCKMNSFKQIILENDGHVSHFRQEFMFRYIQFFSIRQIVFDINYLNCFVKPYLAKIKTNKI